MGCKHSSFSIRCRLRCFLAAASHGLICIAWFWPPRKLGLGTAGLPSSVPQPAGRRAGFGHLVHPSSTVWSLLTPFPTTLSLWAPYVSPRDRPEMGQTSRDGPGWSQVSGARAWKVLEFRVQWSQIGMSWEGWGDQARPGR